MKALIKRQAGKTAFTWAALKWFTKAKIISWPINWPCDPHWRTLHLLGIRGNNIEFVLISFGTHEVYLSPILGFSTLFVSEKRRGQYYWALGYTCKGENIRYRHIMFPLLWHQYYQEIVFSTLSRNKIKILNRPSKCPKIYTTTISGQNLGHI